MSIRNGTLFGRALQTSGSAKPLDRNPLRLRGPQGQPVTSHEVLTRIPEWSVPQMLNLLAFSQPHLHKSNSNRVVPADVQNAGLLAFGQ